jgi:hypothetical protein
MNLVELGRYATRVEADLDAEANSFFGGGGLIWVRLMVLEDDLEAAREVLAD